MSAKVNTHDSSRARLIVFVGLPGAGKGTLAQRCVDELAWKHISTGDLCRSHIARQTPIGREIDFTIKSGKLISDRVVVGMITQWLEENVKDGDTLILDGFPRTTAQAEGLLKFAERQNLAVVAVELQASPERVIHRILHRAICGNRDCQRAYSIESGSEFFPRQAGVCDACGSSLVQRSDDTEEAVAHRLEQCLRHQRALLGFFDEMNQPVYVLDGNLVVDRVFKNLRATVPV